MNTHTTFEVKPETSLGHAPQNMRGTRGVAFVDMPHGIHLINPGATFEIVDGPPRVPKASAKVEGNEVTFPAPGHWTVEVTVGQQRGRFVVAVYHREALERRHLTHRTSNQARSEDEVLGILRSIGSHQEIALHNLTPERPLPAVPLMPYGGDHGQ